MSVIEILLIGIALSMDAFAVTISNMLVWPQMKRGRAILQPVFFGIFQGAMPVLGYFLGSLFGTFVERFAGIISFVILGFIGGKMIWDVLHGEKEGDAPAPATPATPAPAPAAPAAAAATLTLAALFLQAIATSIDAFMVGISLCAESVNVWLACGLIALTTFACCLVALVIGRKFGTALGDKAQVVGGVVLVLIGLKALLF